MPRPKQKNLSRHSHQVIPLQSYRSERPETETVQRMATARLVPKAYQVSGDLQGAQDLSVSL